MPTYYEESFAQAPLPDIVPSYVYTQYNDDPYVTAFFTAFNEMAQGYLDWFLDTNLAIWTSSSIEGSLLNFVGTNLYGTSRPVISSVGATQVFGPMGSDPMGSMAMGSYVQTQSGTAHAASDDLYKRTLTWIHYKGDGYQATIEWLRRRIARFLYGANGSDIDIGLITNVNIGNTGTVKIGGFNTFAWNTFAWNTTEIQTFTSGGVLYIKIPNLTVSQSFVDLFNSGYLPVPIQIKYILTIDP